MHGEYFPFQPFASRAGYDSVTGVRFTYDVATIDALKALLRELRTRGRPTFGPRCQPGGWLPDARAWFLEAAVWPDVRWLLEDRGYTLEAVPRPADVPHYDRPAAAPPPPPPPRAHDLGACVATVRAAYPDHALLGLLPEAPPPVVRAAFRALAQAFHPDHGGDETVMVALNRALENLERRSCA
jgi:hypothetical protein